MEQNMMPEQGKNKRNKGKKKSIILGAALGVVAVVLLVGGFVIHTALNRPRTLFEPTEQRTAEITSEATPAFDIQAYLPTEEEPEDGEETIPPELLAAPTATPAQAPAATAAPQEGEPQLSGIVNVALFGIDAEENGGTTSGSMPHTDVNMAVAINFDTKEVSLISIARDVLTTAPGHSGFYKFNGVFNVGGGMDDPKAGFALSSRAMEEWLGGVSVPYYYGLDFQGVIDLVDAIGGIDFELDIDLYDLDNQRIASKGTRHLDGEKVLAYLRMRKTAGGLDYLRTGRQREMMVAIFRKLKDEGKLSMVPDLLKAMGDNLYTNTTLEQTAALANFARSIDPDSIQSYSIYGNMAENYLWRYSMIDQQARLDILKKVYGIDAKPMGVDTQRYEHFLYDSGFKAIQYLNITKKLFEEANATYSESAMTEAQKRAYADCWKKYTDLQTAFNAVNEWMLTLWDDSKALTTGEKNQQRTYYNALLSLENKLQPAADAMKKAFDLKTETDWKRDINQWFAKGSVINDVYVDFR